MVFLRIARCYGEQKHPLPAIADRLCPALPCSIHLSIRDLHDLLSCLLARRFEGCRRRQAAPLFAGLYVDPERA
jgi:hypothetical protein